MSRHSVQKFVRLGHDIEIIKDCRTLPGQLHPEGWLTFEVRYGLIFDGQLTNWSDVVRAEDDERTAFRMADLGRRRALRLGPIAAGTGCSGTPCASPAALTGGEDGTESSDQQAAG